MSGTKRPSTDTALTVTSGPSTCSSTSTAPPRDSASAVASAASSSPGERTSASPRWPCRSGAFTTRGNGSSASRGSSSRACGTPAAANASRWRAFDVTMDPVRAVIGCASPIRSATRAAIPTGQSAPGETIPSTSRARASRSTASSSSDEMIARSSASTNPTACGSRSTAITCTSSLPWAASSSPSCAGPAPRTRRRRRARERPATRPRCRGTRPRCAGALPRTRSRPASR